MKILFVLFLITGTALSAGAQWVQLGNDIDGEYESGYSGTSVSINGDGSIIAIGDPENSDNAAYSGQVRVFTYDNGSWEQLGDDIEGDSINSESGRSVCITKTDTIIAIGASGVGGNYVKVMRYNSGSWQQMGNKIIGEYGVGFGWSVSMNQDGSILAIGASAGGPIGAGIVRVFWYDNGTWIQLGADIEGEAIGDRFGNSVSLNADGTLVAIGAPYYSESSIFTGLAQVYKFDNGNWMQLGSDIYDGTDNVAGYSVSMNSVGDIIAVSEPGNDNNGNGSGRVRVFSFDGSDWVQMGNDINGEAAYDRFGFSLSMNEDGSMIVVGTYIEGGWNCYVKTYCYSNNDWDQVGATLYNNEGGFFGYSVDINSNGSIIVVGVPEKEDGLYYVGQTRAFHYNPVHVEENSTEGGIIIFPNPASEKIIINANSILNVVFCDLSGKEFITTACSGFKIELNVSDLARGVYIVKVVTEKGVVSEKVILQ